MKYCLAAVVLFCLAAISCRSTNKDFIVADSMKVVIWDMLKADEIYNRLVQKDSTFRNSKENIRYYEEVYALHHITKKQFDLTYKYYETHPVEFKILLDSVDAYAAREQARVNDASVKKPVGK
jgi:hypothetical protein